MMTDYNSFKIFHIITGLEVGGAEMMLYKLLREMRKYNHQVIVISLMNDGPMRDLISSLGVRVYSLGISQGKVPGYKSIRKYFELLRLYSPDIVQGWMYHGNIAATVAVFVLNKELKLYWNVRQTLYSFRREKILTKIVIRFSALISRIPENIIYNSYLSMSQHEAIGFERRGGVVLPNGFDLNEFSPSYRYSSDIRTRLNIKDNDIVVGHVARYHPMKGHSNFLKAAEIVLEVYDDVHFVLVGQGVTDDNENLMSDVMNVSKYKNIHLLGRRADLSRLMPCFDIFVSSSSWGEGFPNVVGEGMASGVPCIVTDVGDSALIVGDSGYVCEPDNSVKLADCIKRMINSPDVRYDLSISGVERIREYFTIEGVALLYLNLYCDKL